MRQVTTNEVLALNKFLQMETNSLTMAKAGVNVISDQQLKTLAQSGITATEGRIRGIQQFIEENNIASAVATNITANPSIDNQELNNNLPKGVM
jgi:ferritin-like metal-binding protein YciE